MRFTFVSLAALAVPAFAQNGPPAAISSLLASLTSAGVIPTDFPTNGPPAQWSSIYNSLVSQGIIPSTLTAAPWPTGSYGPGQGPWGPGSPGFGPGGNHGPGGGRHWGGSDGVGPWGTGGPWSYWSTNSAWRTNAPWTNWWGGSACPGTDWPGWTVGPWGTSPPWTSWAGCSASTTATSVITTIVSGNQVTSTAYGIQVAAADSTSDSVTGDSATRSTGAAAPMKTAGPILAVGAAILGVAAL